MRVVAPGFRLGAAAKVCFSVSGRLLGQIGRRVVVYDVPNRRERVVSHWHFAHPAAMAFDPQDAWFAVRSTTGALVVAEVGSGDPLVRLAPPRDEADDSPLAVGPDGQHLVEACVSGTLRVRRTHDLRVEYVEQRPDVQWHCLTHTPDARRWAFVRRANDSAPVEMPREVVELRTWPLSAGGQELLSADVRYVGGLALAPTGREILVLDQPMGQGPLRLQRMAVPDGRVLAVREHASWQPYKGLAWSPDGRWVVVATTHGHMLLDGVTLAPLGELDGEYASSAAFSPDGTLVALGYWGHGLALSTARLGECFRPAVVRDAAT